MNPGRTGLVYRPHASPPLSSPLRPFPAAAVLTSWRAPAVMLLFIAGLYLFARPWLIERLGLVTCLIIVLAGCLAAGLGTAAWQAHRRRYACPDCGHLFSASTGRHLRSQDWFGRLRCRCPSCGQVGSCQPVGTAAG